MNGATMTKPYFRGDFLGVALAAGVLPILPAAVHAASPVALLERQDRGPRLPCGAAEGVREHYLSALRRGPLSDLRPGPACLPRHGRTRSAARKAISSAKPSWRVDAGVREREESCSA